jgi:hypothetical protein
VEDLIEVQVTKIQDEGRDIADRIGATTSSVRVKMMFFA